MVLLYSSLRIAFPCILLITHNVNLYTSASNTRGTTAQYGGSSS